MKKMSFSLYLFVHAIVAFLFGGFTHIAALYVVGFVFLIAAFITYYIPNEERRDEQRRQLVAREASAPGSEDDKLAEQVERLSKDVDRLAREVERLRGLEPSGSTEVDVDSSRVVANPEEPSGEAADGLDAPAASKASVPKPQPAKTLHDDAERVDAPAAIKASVPKPQPAKPQVDVSQAQSASTKRAYHDRSLRLSNLRISGTESRTPKEPTEEETGHLQRIADSFFVGRDKVLEVPSGNLSADRLSVMTELYLFLKASDQRGIATFASRGTKAEKDRIECLRSERTYSSRCYDGGCSGFEEEHYQVEEMLQISIISEERWNLACDQSDHERTQTPAQWRYYGTLKNDDAPVLADVDKLYLHRPFGSVFDFLLDWQYLKHYLGEW